MSSRKGAFEYFLKKLEQMYLSKPTEVLGIDSILVHLMLCTVAASAYSQLDPTPSLSAHTFDLPIGGRFCRRQGREGIWDTNYESLN